MARPSPLKGRSGWVVVALAALVVADLVGGAAGLTTIGRGSSAPVARQAPVSASVLGIADGSGMMFRSGGQMRRDMAGMAAAGARWVRFDLWWAAVERRPGHDDWRAADSAVRAARAHGLSVVLIPMHPPVWARPPGGDDGSPPADPAVYGAFVGRAARHLAPLGVHVWEIWNEPNTPGAWSPSPDPVAYAALLRAGASSIRRSDPGATILFGGLAPGGDDRADPVDFVRRAYDAGARGSFDAVGIHPYGTKALDTGPARAVHDVMAAAGDGGLPVWATEFGVPTSTDDAGVTEGEQADIIGRAAAEWRAVPGAGPLFVYMFRDLGPDRDDAESNFGLVRRDGTPKPALTTFRAAARESG